jgi:hypothetical protein
LELVEDWLLSFTMRTGSMMEHDEEDVDLRVFPSKKIQETWKSSERLLFAVPDSSEKESMKIVPNPVSHDPE